MTPMRVVCLGCGDAFSARWYSSCMAVEAAGQWLLIDCPHPIRKILRESGGAAGLTLDVERVSAVVLTHLHADHASGLEGWAYYNHFFLKRKTVVLTHPMVSADLWDHHLRASMGSADDAGSRLRDYFEIQDLYDAAPVTFGPFSIECRRTQHPIPTFALRIEAGGRRFGCSADTSFDPSLIDWLSCCDLIVHETNYGIHTAYEELVALPKALRERMRLIHYPDDFDVDGSVIPTLAEGESLWI